MHPNFQAYSNATFAFSEDMPELTDEMRDRARVFGDELDDLTVYDFDSIAWMLRDFEMSVTAKKQRDD